MQQSKFLDPSIGLDESVTFHYGLPWVLSLLCELAPKNLKYAKVGWFWCSLAQADPSGGAEPAQGLVAGSLKQPNIT